MDEPTRDRTGAAPERDIDAGGDGQRVAVRDALGRAFGGIFTIWVMPRQTARHCERTPLWAAGLAHLLAILVAIYICMVGVAFVSAARRPREEVLWKAIQELTEMPEDIWRELSRSREAVLFLVVWLLFLELMFVLAALVLVPWSARDEPARQTWRRALRTTWLWTGTAVPCLCVLWLAVFEVQWHRAEWYRTSSPRVFPSSIPVEPWLVRHGYALIPLVAIALASWALFVLLRAGATAQKSPPRARPPICEECGYNLSHTLQDSRCPECGTPVSESRDPGLRRPNEWELATGLRPLGALVGCGLAAAFRPRRFFRTMQTRQGLPRARTFFIVYFVLTVLIAPLLGLWIGAWEGPLGDDVLPILGLSLVFALFTLVWPFFLAASVGLYCRWTWHENVMPRVAKVFCYTHGSLVLMIAVCGFFWGPIVGLANTASRSRWKIGDVPADLVIILAWLGFCGLCLFVHCRVALAGVRQVRYANS